MANKSKFQKGMEVKSILNKFEKYEIVEVKKNKLVVSPVGKPDLKYTCEKNIFEVL